MLPGLGVTIVFKTSADITSRQVLWEQGGGNNGLNLYIDAGKIYINAFTSDWGPTGLNAQSLENYLMSKYAIGS
ncbi:MAG: hypothetical protein KAR47_20395 [Planctomycetes bacterium]|nr:hypothetical protein [Planctomycetota bacterium]